MGPKEIHNILIRHAKLVGLPEYYKDDLLVHDLNYLRKFKPKSFAWVLRTCGTHMYYPYEESNIYGLYVTDKVFVDDRKYFYYFNGSTLESYSVNRVMKIMANARISAGLKFSARDFYALRHYGVYPIPATYQGQYVNSVNFEGVSNEPATMQVTTPATNTSSIVSIMPGVEV